MSSYSRDWRFVRAFAILDEDGRVASQRTIRPIMKTKDFYEQRQTRNIKEAGAIAHRVFARERLCACGIRA